MAGNSGFESVLFPYGSNQGFVAKLLNRKKQRNDLRPPEVLDLSL
jgi:hypothetical protein